MAHRVQHNNSRGPFKGGFKFHPEASLDDVERCVTCYIISVTLLLCYNSVVQQQCVMPDSGILHKCYMSHKVSCKTMGQAALL
jgi:hypothetical protein